jgi:nicotinic acid phosphoribosyltransferase
MIKQQNILMTDAYKLSMAEAGFPLRMETFYYTHRRGGLNGWHYMPINVKDYIKNLLPIMPNDSDYQFLEANHYAIGAGVRKAFSMTDKVSVTAIPQGAWFYNREPAFSVTGPSALVSWLEPMTLMLHFIIQVATKAKLNQLPDEMSATCYEEKDMILTTCERVGRKAPNVLVKDGEYYQGILEKAKALVETVGNPDRIFEVGMRGVSCMEQHRIALNAIKEAGILRTSNVYLAKELGMIPVGTMGHEHPERFGSDYNSFKTMRDRVPGFVSYLPDTFDSIRSGIPAAIKVIEECPERAAGIRFDSEERIKNHYMYTLTEFQRRNLQQMLILEGGWNLAKTREFEAYRVAFDWSPNLQSYGYGGYLTEPAWNTFRRDDVAAVWKLTQSGGMPCMKFGDDEKHSKRSTPGFPVIYRPKPMLSKPEYTIGIIAQQGENVFSEGEDYYYSLSDAEHPLLDPDFYAKVVLPKYSEETERLVALCKENRRANIVGF